MSESPTQSFVILDAAQVKTAQSLAAAHGVEAEQLPQRGIDPVATVTLVLAGSAAAVGTVLHLLDQRKGGQVIDLRPGTPKPFYRTPQLMYGMVVIVAVDGRVTVMVKRPDGMFGKVIAALPELLAGSGGRMSQVAQVIAETFGPNVTVETAEAGPAEVENAKDQQ